jgi:hypothetical protein
MNALAWNGAFWYSLDAGPFPSLYLPASPFVAKRIVPGIVPSKLLLELRDFEMNLSLLFLSQLTSLSITTILFFTASKALYVQYQTPYSTRQLYRDFDGNATPRTIASSPNSRSKVVIVVFSASGTLCSAISLALLILSEIPSKERSGNFINFTIWVRSPLLSIAATY